MKVKDLMAHVVDKVDIYTFEDGETNFVLRDGHFLNIPDSVSEMEVKYICCSALCKLNICVKANT